MTQNSRVYNLNTFYILIYYFVGKGRNDFAIVDLLKKQTQTPLHPLFSLD